MLDYNVSLIACTLLLSILTFWRSVIFRRRVTEQSNLLTIQTGKFKEIQEELQHHETSHTREECFISDLKHAEVTTELQKTRSSYMHNRNVQHPPERYKYVRSMWDSGMQTEEISSALGMSSNEITQLLKLANLCCNEKDSRDKHEMFSPA
jgi:hypothetical protein